MEKDIRNILVRDEKDWVIISVKDRVDSFNFADWSGTLEAVTKKGQKNVAFDLAHAKFLSLPSIKSLGALADALNPQGRQVAIVAPSEKLKRQIDVYGDIEKLKLFRSAGDLNI